MKYLTFYLFSKTNISYIGMNHINLRMNFHKPFEMYDEEIDVKEDADEIESDTTESSLENEGSRDLRTPSAKQRKLLMSSSSGRRSRSRLRAVDYDEVIESVKEDHDNYDVHEAKRDYEKDYNDLNLSEDIKDIFKYIPMYYPQKTKIDYKLVPFIPDYLPAVGDADAFLKVIPPDPDIQQGIGLEYLDEPSLNQSDPCLLNLQLRASSTVSTKNLIVKKLENAEKNPKVIEQWIQNINDLNRNKTSTFFYSVKMPDVETLMAKWTEDDKRTAPNFDNDLPTVIDEVCDYFGIPKTETKIESLHVLFSVYLAIKKAQSQNTTVLPTSTNTTPENRPNNY
ncbi:intraflagellar transport protein 46 homolog isoform X2 [Daktulosphaira vitifoliae]|uniref:intraflagellar transport protein 46 homolog isoform X2 n=1 Tax=Daktulosphaira vitifoliae TaxID=58002 RepID=UPI0021AAC79E|nr:intraflagellar transport protein 46 homolog isoform X2 [Daktulosphaira vitifoliae]